jgi:hypothetical protein
MYRPAHAAFHRAVRLPIHRYPSIDRSIDRSAIYASIFDSNGSLHLSARLVHARAKRRGTPASIGGAKDMYGLDTLTVPKSMPIDSSST